MIDHAETLSRNNVDITRYTLDVIDVGSVITGAFRRKAGGQSNPYDFAKVGGGQGWHFGSAMGFLKGLSPPEASAIKEAPEHARSTRMFEFPQCLSLDLPNSLARY